MKTPYDDAEKIAELQHKLRKNPPYDLDVLREKIMARLNEANAFGPKIELGSKILDVGCGIGDTVKIRAGPVCLDSFYPKISGALRV